MGTPGVRVNLDLMAWVNQGNKWVNRVVHHHLEWVKVKIIFRNSLDKKQCYKINNQWVMVNSQAVFRV